MITIAALFVVMPVLRDGRMCILDCANTYRSYAQIDWLRPATFLNVDNDVQSARPGEFVVHLPAYIGARALTHYWYQSGLVLVLTMLMLAVVVARVTQRALIGGWVALCALFVPAFAENYYTLGKCEPFMLFGALGVTWVLYRALYAPPRGGGRWLLLVLAGAVFAFSAITVKETGGAFLGAYLAGWFVLSWAAPISWWCAVRRTWWLTLFVGLSFALLVHCVLALPSWYTQGDTGTYTPTTGNLLQGMLVIVQHYQACATYVWGGLLALVVAMAHPAQWRRGPHRQLLAWTAYFWILAAALTLVYAPWTSLQPRYLLPGHVCALAATVLSLVMFWRSVAQARWRLWRWICQCACVLVVLLLVAQCVFTVLVEHTSEGMVRLRMDKAYDEMFRYIAKATPQGGTAYFMYDAAHEESRYNTRFGMPLFYGRPDIGCVFPRTRQEINNAGLVAVSTIAAACNPNRTPVHAGASELFYQMLAPSLPLKERTRFVYETPVRYISAKAYRGFQYATCWGIPAFWRLQRGMHRFGWIIYEYAPHAGAVNILQNSDFVYGLQQWGAWGAAADKTNLVSTSPRCVRIENPDATMPGIKQHVAINMISGAVYRLSGAARYVGVPDPGKIMGARVTVWLPPQPEYDITWLTQRDAWMRVERTFTNQVNGAAVADIRLERLP
ncbi:MAG: carbohydrate binding domain-containing protein [bacterium]|nr:carbohydrate binding domain-containing protein [bacterium]